MDLNTQTLEILKLISDTSECLCHSKVLFPGNNGDKDVADRILTGLMTCLVAAMGDNTKLAYNILPIYLDSNKDKLADADYKKCSRESMAYYEKFRDIGARVQFSSADWENIMNEEFTDYIIASMKAEASNEGHKVVLDIVRNLVDISKSYTQSEVTIIKRVTHKKTIIALAAAVTLLFAALGSGAVYTYNLKKRTDELSTSVSDLQNMNSELISTVSSQEEVIASLNGQIDDLNDKNLALDDEITEFSSYIEEHEADIQVAEHIETYDTTGEEGSGRFYADNYVVTTSGDDVTIKVTMDFYGTCNLQGDNKRISAAWDDHFTDNGTIVVTFTPVKKGATTFHFFNDQNSDTFDVLVIYI
ncbi:hypothetical protein [Butyrivibrio fibrisolvens]|uniref:hypothetical protein n=1 Tax=Butyrivibrio fibrisolvens TaxID=831 RepID=UPI0003FBD552|nr:hypothetical protein [Butyrivibrio fibrisolvens]